MLITRLSRPFFRFSKFRCYSGGHEHEKVLDDHDGVNRRINRVIRHELAWEYHHPHSESYRYRDPRWLALNAQRKDYIYTVLLSGFMWAWVFYHFFYEGHELYSKHYPNPKVDLLSDEHLGIPPDEEGLAREKKWVKTIEIPLAHTSSYNYPKAYLVAGYNDEGQYKM